MTSRFRRAPIRRASLAEVALMPLDPGIVLDPTTSELTEPYAVLTMDDDGAIQAMVYTLESITVTRTYWPGHADVRWPPTRVATTPQQVRQMTAERPQHMVAVPESVVWQMYQGWNIACTAPTPA